MTTIENIKNSIKHFEKVQSRLRTFGAMDTEPDGIFQGIIVRAVKGDDCHIPVGANFWELYSDMDGVESASSELSMAAKDVVDAIHNCPVKDLPQVKKYVKEYCWRWF